MEFLSAGIPLPPVDICNQVVSGGGAHLAPHHVSHQPAAVPLIEGPIIFQAPQDAIEVNRIVNQPQVDATVHPSQAQIVTVFDDRFQSIWGPGATADHLTGTSVRSFST